MKFKIEDVHVVQVIPEGLAPFRVVPEAWSTALILATVFNGTNGRYSDSRIYSGEGSIRVTFIKALRAAFKLGLKEAKLLLDAAQEQDMANRLETSLENNSEESTEDF